MDYIDFLKKLEGVCSKVRAKQKWGDGIDVRVLVSSACPGCEQEHGFSTMMDYTYYELPEHENPYALAQLVAEEQQSITSTKEVDGDDIKEHIILADRNLNVMWFATQILFPFMDSIGWGEKEKISYALLIGDPMFETGNYQKSYFDGYEILTYTYYRLNLRLFYERYMSSK